MMLTQRTTAVLLASLLLAATARADLPGMRFDRLAPLGGSAGTSVEIEVAGANLDGLDSLHFDHPGLSAKLVKDRKFALTIADDVPPGTYDVRLVGTRGVSNPRLFSVSRGLTEVAKKDPADADNPQIVSLNSAINGTCGGNRVDVFQFAGTKGQRITVECQAGKLDSAMDANLSVTTATGQAIVSNGGYSGRDALVDLVIPADGDYRVRVHDLSYRGGFPYRLLISDRPQVASVFPRVVQVGKEVELTVLGRNLGAGSKPSTWREFDLPLDEAKVRITAPADGLDLGRYVFREHPTDHAVLPTAATSTLRGFQIAPKFGDATANAQTLMLTDSPVTIEAEPNDTSDTAMSLTLPAVVSGRFDRPRDVDWYEFETTTGGQHTFEVYCERLAGRADPFLLVTDLKGNRVAELDDLGPRVNAFDGHLRDPSGMVSLTAKTRYRVLVQERYSRGGPRSQYVLAVRLAVPDFNVAVIHSANPGPAGTTVRAGGAIHLDVVLQTTGGFRDPVVLTAEGLPPGLHAAPTTIRGTRGVFVLWADADAADWTGTIRLIASAKVGDETLKREVRPFTRVWSEANMNSSRPTRDLVVAVRNPAPFGLLFTQELIEIEAGQKATVKLRLDRIDKEFREKLSLLPLESGGPTLSGPEIAAGASESTVTIAVPANATAGEYTATLIGQGQVPVNRDPKMPGKMNVLVSLPARPITVVVLAKK